MEDYSSENYDVNLSFEEAEHDLLLFQTDFDHPNQLEGLLSESWNCAVLDCGASKTVCGKAWLKRYESSLPIHEYQKIQLTESSSVYRFGDGQKVQSIGNVKLPAVIGSKKVIIDTDVVDQDIPLLFSRSSMKKSQMRLDFKNDTINVFDRDVPLNITQSGHYTIPICPSVQLLQHVDCNEVNVSLSGVNNQPTDSIKALPSIPSESHVVSVLFKSTR